MANNRELVESRVFFKWVEDGSMSNIKEFTVKKVSEDPEAFKRIINFANEDNLTPLHAAAGEHEFEDVVEHLLKYGANVDAMDANGNTPLLLSCCRDPPSNPETPSLLLKYGATIDAVNDDGCNALMLALQYSLVSTASMLLAHGGIDVNATDCIGMTALMHSISGGCAFEISEELFAHGADINMADKRGLTALHLALHDYKDLATLQMLLEHGANIEAKTNVNEYDTGARIECHFALNIRFSFFISHSYCFTNYVYLCSRNIGRENPTDDGTRQWFCEIE